MSTSFLSLPQDIHQLIPEVTDESILFRILSNLRLVCKELNNLYEPAFRKNYMGCLTIDFTKRCYDKTLLGRARQYLDHLTSIRFDGHTFHQDDVERPSLKTWGPFLETIKFVCTNAKITFNPPPRVKHLTENWQMDYQWSDHVEFTLRHLQGTIGNVEFLHIGVPIPAAEVRHLSYFPANKVGGLLQNKFTELTSLHLSFTFNQVMRGDDMEACAGNLTSRCNALKLLRDLKLHMSFPSDADDEYIYTRVLFDLDHENICELHTKFCDLVLQGLNVDKITKLSLRGWSNTGEAMSALLARTTSLDRLELIDIGFGSKRAYRKLWGHIRSIQPLKSLYLHRLRSNWDHSNSHGNGPAWIVTFNGADRCYQSSILSASLPTWKFGEYRRHKACCELSNETYCSCGPCMLQTADFYRNIFSHIIY